MRKLLGPQRSPGELSAQSRQCLLDEGIAALRSRQPHLIFGFIGAGDNQLPPVPGKAKRQKSDEPPIGARLTHDGRDEAARKRRVPGRYKRRILERRRPGTPPIEVVPPPLKAAIPNQRVSFGVYREPARHLLVSHSTLSGRPAAGTRVR